MKTEPEPTSEQIEDAKAWLGQYDWGAWVITLLARTDDQAEWLHMVNGMRRSFDGHGESGPTSWAQD